MCVNNVRQQCASTVVPLILLITALLVCSEQYKIYSGCSVRTGAVPFPLRGGDFFQFGLLWPDFYTKELVDRLHKAVLRIRIRSDPVFLGHPDLDPDQGKYRILYPQKDPMLLKFSRFKIV